MRKNRLKEGNEPVIKAEEESSQMVVEQPKQEEPMEVDYADMSEEDQIRLAMEMSMKDYTGQKFG